MGLLNKNIKEECRLVNKIKAYIPNIGDLLNQVTDDIKINELESLIGKKVPEDFRRLYLEHNGEGNMIFGVMAGFRWMNIELVINEWKSLQESAYDIIGDKDGLIKEGTFKKGWIPFAEDCGGSFLVMDLEPGIKGTYGQIITIDHNSSISYVISESIEMFFEFIEKSFKNGDLNTWQDEDGREIEWKQGHLFDYVIALTGTKIDKGTFLINGFWEEYFKDEVVNGTISTEVLSKRRMIFIKADMAKKFGVISLDILKNMINLKELIIHADDISSFEPIKEIPSLAKLIIGSKSFKESDLKYIYNVKELTLVKLKLNDIRILQDIKTLKYLRLYKIAKLNTISIGYLKNLTKLSLEDMEVGDLSYISALNKLTNLELKKVSIPNLEFLQDLKNITTLNTDTKADDESSIGIFEGMQKLKELIYPIGDMKIIKNCINLKSIGVDAVKLENLQCINDLNINNITIFNAKSEENAKSIVAEFEKYCKLQSYGWKQTWES
ncbi:MAG: SMI1/KNR4 family protein [Tepidibacter sp.]|jgi:internalin A|uniref:SMI1/KNR4 family protein n=1 Tax=Tepidibacter sp. TaxID=2529387 RepID=UPI0025DA5AC1|nr:SMI1/KNR4 family protein [Tepidibacter sp.]MCT4507407.1 SMI1/KNR4 family protein [Tepidibacter sp.]